MNNKGGFFLAVIMVLFLLSSCKKSPANICVGVYSGTYTKDTVVGGNGTTSVVEVNPLTVNFTISLDSLSPMAVNDVAVNGGGEPYILYYSGIAGTLNGTVSSTDMLWTLMNATDTFTFTGVKQ